MDYAVLTFLVGLIFTIIGQLCSLLVLCSLRYYQVSFVLAVGRYKAAVFRQPCYLQIIAVLLAMLPEAGLSMHN